MIDTAALREKVLDLAIRGKLVPQDPNDEPASLLLDRIRQQKQQMVKDGKLKPKDIKGDTVIFVGEDNLHQIEKCICMDLDGFARVDVLQEPFELNGFRQVIVLFWDAADEEGFRLISGLNFYLRKKNCYKDHLLIYGAAKVHNKDSIYLCNIFFENFFRKRKKRAGSAEKSAKPAL